MDKGRHRYSLSVSFDLEVELLQGDTSQQPPSIEDVKEVLSSGCLEFIQEISAVDDGDDIFVVTACMTGIKGIEGPYAI